jgi:hypothetical protein
MRTRFVGHACLETEVRGLRLLSDPWWAGPAYTDQWHPWPTPASAGVDGGRVDLLYLSHGHEDHLHPPTLERIGRDVTVLVPAFVAGGMDGYVRSLGFERVVPMRHGERITLAGGVTATCYVNATDSMLVVEDGDEVLVNANDALHASPAPVASHFCELLRRNHPRIDALFLGFGGASWFPNCQRLPGKDDRAAAAHREALLAERFADIVERLAPRLACAFAASFVLLEPHLRWVNGVKLEAPGPEAAVARRARGGHATPCRLLAPGDVIEGAAVHPAGGGRPTIADFDRACREGELREASGRLSALAPVSAGALGELAARIEDRLAGNGAARGRALELDLLVREAPGAAIRVGGATARIREPRPGARALEFRAQILRAVLDEPYGTEAITIGCGAVAHLRRADDLGDVLAVLRLLSPRTATSWKGVAAELWRSPWAISRGVVAQRWPLALHAAARAGIIRSLQSASAMSAPVT